MGSFSLIHWLVFGVVAIVLLGGGRFSNLMGDVAKGLKNFKKGMAEEEEALVEPTRIQAQKAAEPAFKTEAERVPEDR